IAGDIGNLDINNLVIKDTLPVGAQFISASNGGVEAGGVVTWNLGDNHRNDLSVTVSVYYPSPTFTDADTVVNHVEAQYVPLGENLVTKNASIPHAFTAISAD